MSLVLVLCISLLAAGVVALIVFLVRSLATPRKVESVEKLLRGGKPQQAIKLAKSILAKNRWDMKVHYILGKAYLADNKPELALIEFKTVGNSGAFSDKIPEQEFRQSIAKLYLRFNQQEEALKEYLLLTKLAPEKAEYCLRAAELFEQRNNSEQALAYYQKAVDIDPRNAEARAAFGFLLYKTNHTRVAEREIAAALKLDPQNAKAHFYHGRILMEKKEYAKAIAAFEKAVRAPELKQKAFIERGRCYMEAGNFEKAAFEFNLAVKTASSPSSSDTLHARYFLASCLEKTRDIDGAVAQWQEIQKQKKNFMDVAKKLALYQNATAGDNIKEYLTASKEDFLAICKSIVTDYLKLTPSANVKETKYGCVLVAVETDEGMLNMRKVAHLVVFYRDATPIGENFLRNLLEVMKKRSLVRVMVFTSSSFTRSAIRLAENRPIVLVPPQKLETILRAAIPASKK